MRVFLNPGHALGGNPDSGFSHPRLQLRECNLALTYGSLCGRYLELAGCAVKLLQSHNLSGENPGYPCVVDMANQWGADVFVSIHVNAGGGRGPETYCYRTDGAGGQLAACIQHQLLWGLAPYDRGYVDRGIKEHPSFCVLRNTIMPAVLVEVGFIDSDDVGILTQHGDDIARAIAQGIADYWRDTKTSVPIDMLLGE
ncbi:N-acetylmuramoyl-L-alanine amidase [Selenomonas sp. GACV-9]|uniref:N-acetylmuramoyl-L-alanine amidase family protein n=1 Tax=Selenomonas sp. GACV-9 TaxID=3158782 RepID=UPI0008EA858A|nr:N-acetylmuramoyl-L-alanine amidase [Selenomonas ruminantium]